MGTRGNGIYCSYEFNRNDSGLLQGEKRWIKKKHIVKSLVKYGMIQGRMKA